MAERTVTAEPSGLSSAISMAKAALPVVPGVNMLPGVAKRGGDLPDLTLKRESISIDPAHVAAYAEVCGFTPHNALPLTYPHMLAFPLHMAIMTDSSFPFPAIGTVHLRNEISTHREILPTEKLSVAAKATNLREVAKGKAFDFVTTITSGDELVWESTSTYLRIGKGNPDASPEVPPFEVIAGTGAVWKLAGNLGRRYAAVSGDHNPIHLYPVTAKALGFKRQIAHGMWSKARCVAALDGRSPAAATVSVEFKKPIFLPGQVAFGSKTVSDGIDFSLTNPRNGAPHLVGRLRANG
jgi:hypothetical protein